MAYQVGIDLGTTSTVAAVCAADGTARVVPLEGSTGAVASVVHLGADGSVIVGEAAARRALAEPGRVVRDLTRRIGDDTPVLIGHEPVPAGEPAARFLAHLVDDVARREGGVASRVAVTHPAAWGQHRIAALRAALGGHGLGSALLVSAPVAAVRARRAGLPAGPVAVYDLGGGGCTASVVRRTAAGLALAGPAEELDRGGGGDLDELVFGHVRTALGAAWDALEPTDPDVLAAVADLRRECTVAKEALSRDTEALVSVALPGLRTQVRVGRAELEDMFRPAVEETVEALHRAVRAAGVAPSALAAVLLVGGAVQVPLVPQLLEEAFGRPVTVAADPVGAVATGAALLVHEPGRPASPPPAPARARPPRPARTIPAVGPVAAAVPPAATGAAEPAVPAPAREEAAPGTAVLPVARPPKQARPFTPATASPSRLRRTLILVSAAVFVLAVLSGIVVVGASRFVAGREAGAATPAPAVTTPPAPAPVVVPPPPPTPARTGPAPGRRTRPAPPPPPTSAPATTRPPTPPATPPDPTTAPPATTEEAPAGAGPGGSGGQGGQQGAAADVDAADPPAEPAAAPGEQAAAAGADG